MALRLFIPISRHVRIFWETPVLLPFRRLQLRLRLKASSRARCSSTSRGLTRTEDEGPRAQAKINHSIDRRSFISAAALAVAFPGNATAEVVSRLLDAPLRQQQRSGGQGAWCR